MKKKIIAIIVILIFALGSGGVLYLNNVYLPTKARIDLAHAISTATNCNVEIDTLKYNPFQGLIIQGITFYDKQKDKENTLLTIKDVRFNFLFLPLFKERKIIIPIMHINSPSIYLRYQKDGSFNCTKIYDTLSKPPKEPPKIKFSFLIYKIIVSGGTLVFKDTNTSPEFTKTIEDINAGINMKPLAEVAFLLQARFNTGKDAFTKVGIRGTYNFASGHLASKLNLVNLNFTDFNSYLTKIPISINAGSFINTDLEFHFKDKILGITGTANTKGLDINKENLALLGDIDIQPQVRYSFDKKELSYEASLSLNQAGLKGVPYVDKIEKISGLIELKKDKIHTRNLKINALDSDIELSGEVENFANPSVKINLSSEKINLEKLLSVFKYPDIKISGLAKIKASIEGKLNNLPLKLNADFDISEAQAETSFLKNPLNNIHGYLNLTQNTAKWEKLFFNYSSDVYETSGQLTDFDAPKIKSELSSEGLKVTSDIKVKNKIININSIIAKFKESEIKLTGSVNIQDSNNTVLDIDTKSKLRPLDLLKFLPAELAENIKKTKIDTSLNIAGSIKGSTKNFGDMNMSLKASTDALSAYGLKFSGMNLNIIQKNKQLNIPPFITTAYSGKIKLGLLIRFINNIPEAILNAEASGIDLAKLKLDTDLKDKDLAGILDGKINLYGDISKFQTIKGAGLIQIQKGRLWQLNLLKGLGELLFMPEYSKIIFDQAYGEFEIENESALINSLILKSSQLTLDCSGKYKFDGSLDLTVYSKLNQNLIKDSTDIRKFATAIVGEISESIAIKIGGTIQKPTYKIIPMPLDIIKSIKNFLLGK